MTAQTPASAEMEKWLRYGSGFSQIFDSVSGSGSVRKMQNPAGIDSGKPDPVPPLTTIHWTNILEMIISLFIWKRFCFLGYLTPGNIFGEFVPRLGISAAFGKKFGELRYLGIFSVNCILWDKIGNSQCGHEFSSNTVIRFFWFKYQFQDLVNLL